MRRTLLSQLLLLVLCRQASAASEATVRRLHDDLLNSYDRHVRPVQDYATPIHVTFHIDINDIELLNQDMLRVETFTFWEWKDGLLKWDSNRYDGIKEISVAASSIWTPEIVHLSRGLVGSAMQPMMPRGGVCRVTSDGDVRCLVDAQYYAHCGVELAKWPYDTHSCFLSFVNWLDIDNELTLSLRNATGFSLKYVKSPLEWQLVSITSDQIPRQNDDRKGYRKLDFHFTFKRHSEAYAAAIVTPAIVLSLGTLATLLVPAWEPERFSVGLCLMVAQTLSLIDLYHIFSYETSVPLVVLLYRDALIMAATALVLAVGMRALIQSDVQAPSFLVSLLDQVPTWPWGLSLLAQPREECGGRKESRGPAVWKQLASLVDRSCFCCYCLALLILLASLVP